ncbi:hypothetical protein ACHAWC_007325 [Mediolabrus comicus]
MNECPAPPTSQSSTKIDPITAVQDSIDSLALSLFEALRGVRDAVAPESLDASSSSAAAAAAGNNNTTTTSAAAAAAAAGQSGVLSSSSAFREADELAENATAKERLLNGLNVDYFPPRAFDMLEPDYDAFILAYLSENVHAKELVRRYMATEAWKKRGDEVMMQQQRSRSSKSDDDVTNNNNNREDSSNNNNENDDTAVQIGDVGYEFRKQFDAGWYTGKVTEIILVGNMKNRRCHYNDGDVEDLSLDELKRLAKLDPDSKYYAKKPRLSIKLKVNKSKSSQDKENTNHDGGDGEDHQDDDNNSTSSTSKVRIPLTQEEYTQFLIDTEHQRDIQTTQRLAQTILNKSEQVDNLVAGLPGMHRTRDMQMERIEELLVRNHQVAKELDEAHVLAKERLQEVRKVLGETTFLALGVEEE